MDLSWVFFSLSKFRGTSVLWEKAFFCIFAWPHRENFQVAANRTILTPEGFPIAHLKAYALRFSGNIWKMLVVLKLGVPALPEVSWSRTMTAKMSVFRPLFWRKSLFWLTSTKCWPPLNIHHWKALLESFHMVFFKNYFMNPAMRQNFANAFAETHNLNLEVRLIAFHVNSIFGDGNFSCLIAIKTGLLCQFNLCRWKLVFFGEWNAFFAIQNLTFSKTFKF